jgi:hypothetical protein
MILQYILYIEGYEMSFQRPPLFESAFKGKRGHFDRTGKISTVRLPSVEKLPIWNYWKFKSTMGSLRFAAVVASILLFIYQISPRCTLHNRQRPIDGRIAEARLGEIWNWASNHKLSDTATIVSHRGTIATIYNIGRVRKFTIIFKVRTCLFVLEFYRAQTVRKQKKNSKSV